MERSCGKAWDTGLAHSTAAIVCAWLAACSASTSDQRRGAQQAPTGGAGGVGGAGGAAGISGVGGFGGVGGSTGVGGTGGGSSGTGGGEPTREQITIDACGAGNPAGLSEADAQALMAGGPPGALRMLYPYAGTVFPRGMISPTLMWDGADGSVVYVHLHSNLFDYRGCLPATGPGQLQLPQDVWHQAGDQSAGPADPFTLELTVQTASGPAGPMTQPLVIAQATLKGSIYYNSYVSSGSGSGSVYRIPAGGQAQQFLGGGLGCYGCHAVSANGERMISHIGGDPGSSFALTPTTQPNPPVLASSPGSAFAGLSPDGALYIASAHPVGAVRPQGTPLEVLVSNDAALYQTDTGSAVTGAGIPAGAMMPIFSPGGRLIAFNDFAEQSGRGLAVMDFDPVARNASNRRVVFTDTTTYPGWPFFLPDDMALVFARGSNSQFSGNGAGVMQGAVGNAPQSDLYIVDIASKTVTLLAQAMGLPDPVASSSYTAFGAEDLHKHYYPTVSPVAAGGYFWLFFDSLRHYGNQGVARQLWGSALSIAADGSYASDPSHPAFYVTGQDFSTGNHRAFTALDPCKQDGESCETGIDCCSGFCTDGICGVPEQPRCSETNEACESSADCCNPVDRCISGYCGQLIPE